MRIPASGRFCTPPRRQIQEVSTPLHQFSKGTRPPWKTCRAGHPPDIPDPCLEKDIGVEGQVPWSADGAIHQPDGLYNHIGRCSSAHPGRMVSRPPPPSRLIRQALRRQAPRCACARMCGCGLLRAQHDGSTNSHTHMWCSHVARGGRGFPRDNNVTAAGRPECGPKE